MGAPMPVALPQGDFMPERRFKVIKLKKKHAGPARTFPSEIRTVQAAIAFVKSLEPKTRAKLHRGLLEHLEHLADYRELEQREAGNVAARPRQARHRPLPRGIGDTRQYDPDG